MSSGASVQKPVIVHAVIESPATLKYWSWELEQIQACPTSPMGIQFFSVPVSSVPRPAREEASTRTCDETTLDGKSQLDCIDDND